MPCSSRAVLAFYCCFPLLELPLILQTLTAVMFVALQNGHGIQTDQDEVLFIHL